MAQERKVRTSGVSIAAAACACMASVLVVVDGAVAEKLRVGVNLTTIETLPIYLVESEPAGAGIALSGGAIPALTAGNVDVVTNAETQAILRSTANPEIRVILTVAEYGYRIVARRSAGVRTAMDLRGKKIATSLNSSAHFYIVKTLRNVGLSEADVTVVGMTPPEMPAALARGDVDAVSIWEPAAEQSARALGLDAMILQGPDYRERFNLNTTVRSWPTPPSVRPSRISCVQSSVRRFGSASAGRRCSRSSPQSLACRKRSWRRHGDSSGFRHRSRTISWRAWSNRNRGWRRTRTGLPGPERRLPH
jgi:hypothetical protein